MQLEPPALAPGVPTIWLALFQSGERALKEQPGRWRLPRGIRSLVGGAAVSEGLIRAFARHGIWIPQGWGMTETSPLCTISAPTASLKGARDDECFHRAARRPVDGRDAGARAVHHRQLPRRRLTARQVPHRRVDAHR